MKENITDYEMKDVIQTICELSGATQDEFDEAVRNYEDGELRYTFETVLKIAESYGLNIMIEKNDKNED